ncbi:7924_t:CDS:2 [Funneliformis mosseae]|uniref:7924_t:CDS:1 n=1 Tax=Funneliformis mosseae TaxID=27381 RepID=A0A9N9F0V6_FUNMO|nr:7924_t:CDS:2 [Funneliformis mosseae]
MQTTSTISKRIQNFTSSGSEQLDDYLKSTHVLNQQNPKNLPIFFIPLNEFEKINLLRRGGEGLIYTANWKAGVNGSGPERVVLKKLLGLCRPNTEETKELSSKGSIFGVLPYVAPEVLSNNYYGPEADIYGFSIVAWEILSGKRPYDNLSHDFDLVQLVINGLRPPPVNGVPLQLWNLIQSCWNGDHTQRPTAKELYAKFVKWLLIDKIYEKWDNDSNNEIVENNTSIVCDDDNFSSNHFLSSTLYDTSSCISSMQTSSVISNTVDNLDTRQIDLTIPNCLNESQVINIQNF